MIIVLVFLRSWLAGNELQTVDTQADDLASSQVLVTLDTHCCFTKDYATKLSTNLYAMAISY